MDLLRSRLTAQHIAGVLLLGATEAVRFTVLETYGRDHGAYSAW